MFLNDDERWQNLREYYLEPDGLESDKETTRVTFVFGAIISFICPLVFVVQNILLGLILTNGKFNLQTFTHVFNTTKYQLVVIYDLSMFDTKPDETTKTWWRLLKMGLGYLFYTLPIGGIGYLFLFINTKASVSKSKNHVKLSDRNVI